MLSMRSPFPSSSLTTLASSLLLAASGTVGTAWSNPDPLSEKIPSLKEAYAKAFLIGAAPGVAVEKDPAAQKLLAQQFNAVTPENCMKPESIQPKEGEFDFSHADWLVRFAETHHMKVIGHTLAWHHQTPGWFFKTKDGQPASRELALERLEKHITAVVGRYKGRILGWDVVNEAVGDGNNSQLRENSPWMKVVGPEFIEKAFAYAHAADPDAELYYNDYNVERPDKLKKTIALVKNLQAKGLRIDGVGIQGHWGVKFPLKDLEEAILQLKACGVKVMLTELDMNVLPGRQQGADISDTAKWKSQLDPYAKGCPPEVLRKQADQYAALFGLLLKHRDTVTRVSFWGISDGYSWLNDWPIPGRTNHALLFDRELKPKPAFHAVINAANPSSPADPRP